MKEERVCLGCGMPIPFSAYKCPYCKYEDEAHLDFLIDISKPKPHTIKEMISRVIDRVIYFIVRIIIWLFNFAVILIILLLIIGFIVIVNSDDNLPVISNNKIDYNVSGEYDTKDVVKYDNESLPDITYGNDSGEKSHSEGFVNNDDVSISNNEVNNETINNIEEEERVVEETSESTLSKKEARQQKKEDRKSDRQRRKENSKKERDGE